MSLISDALRKARAEAAQRDAARRGTPPPGPYAHRSRHSPLRSSLLVAAVVTLGAIGAGLLLWRSSPRIEVRRVITVPTPSGTATESISTPERIPAPPVPSPSPPVEASREAAPLDLHSEETARDAAGQTETGSPPSNQRPENPAESSSYVGEAVVAGAALRLDYIVYRGTDPFAMINGIEVREGSSIEGFVVEEIHRNAIQLRNAGGSIILKAR